MRVPTVSALLLVSVLALSGCGNSEATESASTPAESSAGSSGGTATDSAAKPAPTTGSTSEPSSGAVAKTLQFSGETLNGSAFEGASLAGKPTVLWFWAPWCSTCRAQAPGVADLAQRFEGEANVVGVGGLSEVPDIREFAEKVVGPTHLVDEPGVVWRHFGVTAQSTYVVLDASGKVVEKGYLDDGALADKVEQLVG